MSFVGNSPHFHVGKEPKSRTQQDNMKKNQGTNTAEKEDDTDSTATKTTAAFTSVCESEWGDYTTEELVETTILNDQTYVYLWKMKMGEICLQVENIHTYPKFSGKNSPYQCSTQHAARTINGVFMFGSAAQKATKTKSSLVVLQEVPSHQTSLGYQTEATKKPGHWSTFGKFKVDSDKTQKTSATDDATRKQKEHRTKPRITGPYETRNQELKTEENK